MCTRARVSFFSERLAGWLAGCPPKVSTTTPHSDPQGAEVEAEDRLMSGVHCPGCGGVAVAMPKAVAISATPATATATTTTTTSSSATGGAGAGAGAMAGEGDGVGVAADSSDVAMVHSAYKCSKCATVLGDDVVGAVEEAARTSASAVLLQRRSSSGDKRVVALLEAAWRVQQVECRTHTRTHGTFVCRLTVTTCIVVLGSQCHRSTSLRQMYSA